MAYKALYRVYRPQLFREVVGQDVIVKTLQNAIANNKISHAYLLNGPRGTGKTSIARIFAKALNCENPVLMEPCDKCNSCHEITDGISSDVIEIDAASNNGVDEIRDIREKIKFLPSGSKYKIYIIDEVHMLSQGAFNALLKTLEEPPRHAIFILATTEPQKLPETIISRCQRFDFKALTISEISKKIRTVCSTENVEITEEAVNGISESAEGALRDALTILDQAISYSNEQVTIEDVNLVTGNLSYDRLITLASNFDVGNVNGALEEVNQLVDMGKEPSKLVTALLQFYRDILLYKNVDSVMYSKYIFEKEKFKQIANSTSEARIFYYIDVLSDIQIKMRYSTTPRTYLEIAFIKMINTTNNDLDFVKRIDDLEKKITNVRVNETSVVDDEKVNLIEIRLNKVVSELGKLEIHKFIDKVHEIEKKISNDIDFNDDTFSKPNSEMIKQINGINEDILILKSNISNLRNNIGDINKEEGTIVTHSPQNTDNDQLIDGLKNDINNKFFNIYDDLNSLKLEITRVSNEKPVTYNKEIIKDNHDFKELQSKVIAIEKRLYELIAGKLSKKTPTIKRRIKGQLGLFEDIVVTKNTEVEPKVDFKHLANDQESNDVNKINDDLDLLDDVVVESESELFDDNDQEIQEETEENNDFETVEEIEEDDPKVFNEEEETNSFKEEKQTILENDDDKSEQIEIQNNVEMEVSNVVDNTNSHYNSLDDHTSREIIDSEYGVKKPNSQLVVNRNRENIFEKERELLEKEMASIRPTVDVKTRVENNEDIVDVNVGNSKDEEAKRFLTYDIKLIEQILHDSRSEASRNDNKRILQIWERIGEDSSLEMMSIVEMLKKGKIVAVGNKQFILSYDNSAQCNQVMKSSFKEKSLKLLYNELKDTYNYIALPEKIWLEKRREYISQYNIGYKFPKLKPIDDPSLVVIKTQYRDPKDRIVDKTIEIFGDEIVKVE